jgi:hypothetical protein
MGKHSYLYKATCEDVSRTYVRPYNAKPSSPMDHNPKFAEEGTNLLTLRIAAMLKCVVKQFGEPKIGSRVQEESLAPRPRSFHAMQLDWDILQACEILGFAHMLCTNKPKPILIVNKCYHILEICSKAICNIVTCHEYVYHFMDALCAVSSDC